MNRWEFEPGHTAAMFCARHMMVTWVRGHFKDVHGWIDWDPAEPLATTFEAKMDTTRLWTGEPVRDAHLRSADFFDVENHPDMVARGRFVEQVGETNYEALAELTIRGNTRELPLAVTYLGQWSTPYWEGEENRGDMRRVGFNATGAVNRLDFGVSWNDQLDRGGVVVSNQVLLDLDVEAILEDDMVAVGLKEPPG